MTAPGAEIEQSPATEHRRAAVGTQCACQDVQQGGLAGTVVTEHGHLLAGSQRQFHIEAALGHGGSKRQAHASDRSEMLAVTTVTTTATNTSTNDSAMAASVSV